MTNDLPRVVESAVWVLEGLIDGVVLPGSYLKIKYIKFPPWTIFTYTHLSYIFSNYNCFLCFNRYPN